MREDCYKNSVALKGCSQRNGFVMLIRNGDELSGIMSPERVVDALALYACLVMLAPAHRGGKAVNGGVSPFGNERVRYVGSNDDAALNAAVPRFKPDPATVARFAFDVDHAGRFGVPVISAHGIGDATVFVEGSDTLRQRMAAAGNGHRLVQNFVDSAEHSYWGDAYYPPLFNALLNWVEKGQKPTPAGIATSCVQQPGAAAKDCQFLFDYVNKPLASRIFVR